MRFKSRLFPLIDMMILLLGLFLVIMAKAQLPQEDAPPPPPKPKQESGTGERRVVNVEFNFDQGVWVVSGSGRRLESQIDWNAECAERGGEPPDFAVSALLRFRAGTTGIRRELERYVGDSTINWDEPGRR